MIRLEVAGLDAVEKRLMEVPKKIEHKVLLDMSQIVYDKAHDAIDKHTKTGALRQSLYNRAIPGGREVGNDPKRAPHALFVHWGSKPHIIKPKNKKALRWSAGGQFVFSKIVHHPGYKGDPYLVNAARDAMRQFDTIVQNALKGI